VFGPILKSSEKLEHLFARSENFQLFYRAQVLIDPKIKPWGFARFHFPDAIFVMKSAFDSARNRSR
jgi:hypothetical protein